MGQSCWGGRGGDERGMFLRMDDLISVWRSSRDAHGSRSKRNIFTGSVVFFSWAAATTAQQVKMFSIQRARVAHRCLSPKHFHQDILFSASKRKPAPEQQMERLKCPDITSAPSDSVTRERPPQSWIPEHQQQIRFLRSQQPEAGFLFFFNTFRALSMSMNEDSGRSHWRVFQWETKHQEVLSFNEFVSFALIQK